MLLEIRDGSLTKGTEPIGDRVSITGEKRWNDKEIMMRGASAIDVLGVDCNLSAKGNLRPRAKQQEPGGTVGKELQ